VIISEDGGRTMGITQADLDSISWTVGHSLTQNPRMKIDDKTNLTFSLGYVTQAINSLGVLRAYNGAQQTQLNHSLSILSENKMNLETANSRIQDVDVASESAKMASEKIRYEAATAMLAQANQSQQSLLRLIL
jgi:flagellin